MAEINATFVVETIDLTVVQEDPGITFTPDPINLNIYAGGFAQPGGDALTIQFNNNGVLDGAPNTAVSNGNISFGNVGNVKITGGTSGYYLQTDGSGNLTWAQGTANVSGNGTAAGANTQIQISDGTGNFVAGAGFTFDTGTNTLAVPGDVVSSGDFSGVNILGVDGNLTGNMEIAGTLTVGSFTVNSLSATDITATGNIDSTSGVFNGDGYGLANIPGANIVGNASNLTSLTSSGNIDSTSGIFNGDGYGLSNIPAANIIGLSLSSISNGTSNVSIPVADGNVTISVGGQPNRFIVQTVGANVDGNLGVTANVDANIVNANTANVAGNLTANNISVSSNANVQYLTANGFITTNQLALNTGLIRLGTGAGNANTLGDAVAIGFLAGNDGLGNNSIAIGSRAGNLDQANNSIILNATGANLTTSTANSFTVKPVRNDSAGNVLYYDDVTGEITYDAISTQLNANFANYAGNVTVSAQPNITSVGTLTLLDVTGNVDAGNINATGGNFVYIAGNGSALTALTGANVTGFVPNAVHANSATTAGSATSAGVAVNVTANAQPNITSVGTLANLTVVDTILVQGANARLDVQGTGGLITAYTGTYTDLNATANIVGGNITANTLISGNGAGLTNLTGANVTGEVTYANIANYVSGSNVYGTQNYPAYLGTTGSNVFATGTYVWDIEYYPFVDVSAFPLGANFNVQIRMPGNAFCKKGCFNLLLCLILIFNKPYKGRF